MEYVIIEKDEKQIWEIDYKNKIALNISEIVKPESIGKLIEYPGNIQEFLQKERGYKDIHFHDSFRFPARIHLKNSNQKLKGCNFK